MKPFLLFSNRFCCAFAIATLVHLLVWFTVSFVAWNWSFNLYDNVFAARMLLIACLVGTVIVTVEDNRDYL